MNFWENKFNKLSLEEKDKLKNILYWQFIKFIMKNKISDKIFFNIKNCRLCYNEIGKDSTNLELLKFIKDNFYYDDLFANLFVWDKTKEGFEYWYNVNKDFNRLAERIIKKIYGKEFEI